MEVTTLSEGGETQAVAAGADGTVFLVVEVTEGAWILAVPDAGGAGPVLVQLADHLYDYAFAVEPAQVWGLLPAYEGARAVDLTTGEIRASGGRRLPRPGRPRHRRRRRTAPCSSASATARGRGRRCSGSWDPRPGHDGPMLTTEDRDDVTVLRIEHGRVGAMDAELLDALTDAVTASDRALVLTGTGSAFSAGVDLRRILDGGRPYTEEFLTALSRMFRAVFDHPRPTVAAVNGHAIAGGCVLALACDVRLMSGGRIGLAELAVGVPFPTSALEIVRHALGPDAGRAVLARGDRRPRAGAGPRHGRRGGRAPTSSCPRALALATELAARSPEAYRLAKTQLHRPANEAIEATTAEDDAAVLAGWTSEDTRRRIEAALEALTRR